MPESGAQKRIGQLAVECGLMTAGDLAEALEEHQRRVAAGSQVPLGELLVDLEYISRRQLQKLLSAQGSRKSPRQRIPGYELIKKLGEGGMGTTYLARQTSMKRLVAIKVLRRELSRDEEFIERFRREAQIAGQLLHNNVAQAIDVGEAGGLYYLVMEYVEGKSVTEFIPQGGALDEKLALSVVLQVARALAAGHEHGIVHRDVKPDNILLTADGSAKLCDFGLAKQSDQESRLTQTGMALGTPHYVSPEQAQGERDVDIRSDVYSLGATLYHLVAGRTPYDGAGAAAIAIKHITEPVPRAREVRPTVSDSVDRLITKMMAKDPAHRYQTPTELVADLEEVIAGKTIGIQVLPAGQGTAPGLREDAGTRKTAPLLPAPSPRRIRPVHALIFAGVLLCLAAVVYLTVFREGGEAARTRKIKEAFQLATEEWEENPEDYAAAIERFERVLETAGGTEWEVQARLAVRRVKKARSSSALKLLKGRAAMLAAGGDYDGAIALLKKPPETISEADGREVAGAAAALRAEAEARLRSALEAAERLSAGADHDKGLAELDRAAAVKYAAGAKKLAAARARLERKKGLAETSARKRQEAEAREWLDRTLDRFDQLALAGDYRRAVDHLAAEKKKTGAGITALVAGRLKAIDAVAAELARYAAERSRVRAGLLGREVEVKLRAGGSVKGTVTRVLAGAINLKIKPPRGGAPGGSQRSIAFGDLAGGELERLLPEYRPKGAAGSIALALARAAQERLDEAGGALAGAGDHPLAGRYRKKLQAIATRREGAARRQWGAGPAKLAGGRHAPAGARALLAALDAFLAKHGKTKFAAGRKAQVQRLRVEAWRAAGPRVYTKWPFDAAEARRRQKQTSWSLGLPARRSVDLGGGTRLELVLVPAGEFLMGGRDSLGEFLRRGGKPEDWYAHEHPRHRVRITKPFYMGRHEVTQAVWKKLMGSNPAEFKDARNPVERVSWNSCRQFLEELNKRFKGKLVFRLPTEAQWEYACRAGTAAPFCFGEKLHTDRANYNGAGILPGGKRGVYRRRTTAVGSLPANAWGLHDMHGNVWEWCADWDGEYSKAARTDPRGAPKGTQRVTRGGSWFSPAKRCRSAYRARYDPGTRRNTRGLRVAADVPAGE